VQDVSSRFLPNCDDNILP